VIARTVAKCLGIGHAGGSSGDVNLQRRHGATQASGFVLEYSVHALDVGLWLQRLLQLLPLQQEMQDQCVGARSKSEDEAFLDNEAREKDPVD
jgi:hypothetical protein